LHQITFASNKIASNKIASNNIASNNIASNKQHFELTKIIGL
jgi:hypothetical protein